MSCYHPVAAFRTATGVSFSELRRDDAVGSIELPCGQCIGCRMRRATDWSLRCMHEATLWKENCFVTLTYGRDCVPANGSLEHRDFQLFMKRLRRRFVLPVRFYMCGEYGPVNGRPHYHACLFNVDFRSDRVQAGKSASGMVYYDSALLRELWSHGKVSVQDLSRETAGYCARYIMKKVLGPHSERAYDVVSEDGVVIRRKPEYAAMSLKPGIGSRWFEKYWQDVFPLDAVVSEGRKFQVPRYYDKLLGARRVMYSDELEFARYLRALAVRGENTDSRRAVREVVHEARVKSLTRGDL